MMHRFMIHDMAVNRCLSMIPQVYHHVLFFHIFKYSIHIITYIYILIYIPGSRAPRESPALGTGALARALGSACPAQAAPSS